MIEFWLACGVASVIMAGIYEWRKIRKIRQAVREMGIHVVRHEDYQQQIRDEERDRHV